MKFFSWFRHESKDSNKWEEEREEKEYVKKHNRDIRNAKLQDIRRYNKNKEDRLKI